MQTQPPKHIAIIMDGNGRWAEQHGLPRLDGHQRGADTVREVVRHCRRIGVGALTLYAFSAQNWQRPRTEVMGLMRLLRDFIEGEWDEIMDNDIRLAAVGQVDRLPSFVRDPLDRLASASASNRSMTLSLALSYGGREEIVDAARALAREVAAGRMRPEDIDEEAMDQQMTTRELGRAPDLLIRTSGELRLSNFLLWQSAYTELYFTDTLWPEFTSAALDEAIDEFHSRQRRFGRVEPEGEAEGATDANHRPTDPADSALDAAAEQVRAC